MSMIWHWQQNWRK